MRMGWLDAPKKLVGKLRAKRPVVGRQALIQPGDKLPAAEVVSAEGRAVSLQQVLQGREMSLLVGMPGAFTPTCTSCHLPSLVEAVPRLKTLGVNKIAVITSNDRYVNEAWRRSIEDSMQSKVTLTMLSDADGAALRALGLVDDLGFGMGERSNRFALLAEGGEVKHVAIDKGMNQLDASSVDAVNKVASLPHSLLLASPPLRRPFQLASPPFLFQPLTSLLPPLLSSPPTTKVLDYYQGNAIAPQGFSWGLTW